MRASRDSDALEQRVEKTGGSGPGEFIYFNGMPIAVLSGGSWTDLIWAGKSMIAEVPGSETAAPVYRLLDNEGSLIGLTDNSGTMPGPVVYAPYGQAMSTPTSDSFGYAGLYQDTEYGGDHAWYRSLSTEQIHWLSPDPDNGSYDLMNPQSFNRYAYVTNNPLGLTDQSGLSSLSGTCAYMPDVLITNPYFSSSGAPSIFKTIGIATNYVSYASQVQKGSCEATLEALGEYLGKQFVGKLLSHYLGGGSYFATVQAAMSIGCSIDYSQAACGPPELAWQLGGVTGEVVGDSLDVGYAVCVAGGFANAACDAFALYELANKIYQFFYNLFGWGPPQFTGSLLPRPGDFGGLGTASVGIPNQNLSVQSLLGQAPKSIVPSPGAPTL